MSAAELVRMLAETTLASSAAILVVLAFRRQVRRLAGARVAYALWSMVPVAALAVLLPGPVRRVVLEAGAVHVATGVQAAASPVDAVTGAWPAWAAVLLAAWGLGMLASVLALAARQRRFVRGLGKLQARGDGLWQADAVAGLPAVMGLRPRIVLPADFELRYTADERRLVVAHEALHVRRGDLAANAFAAALRCLYWFNPLLHVASDRFRRDQELACDEGVVARHPASRRAYGEAMLKTGLAGLPVPLACQWPGHHPLKERIAMLRQPSPTRRQWISGTAIVLVLTGSCAYGAWAAQPARLQATGSAAAATDDASGKRGPAANLVSVEFAEAPAREIAAELARQGGLRFDGRMPQAERELTMVLQGVPLESALQLLANETRSVAVVQGGTLRFVPKAAGGAVSGMRVSTAPKYPADAAKAGISGKVLLLVDVDAAGNVTHAEVESATPPGVFDAVSLDAVKRWKFEPRTEGGKPVAARVRVPVTFEADKAEKRAEPASPASGATGTSARNDPDGAALPGRGARPATASGRA